MFSEVNDFCHKPNFKWQIIVLSKIYLYGKLVYLVTHISLTNLPFLPDKVLNDYL